MVAVLVNMDSHFYILMKQVYDSYSIASSSLFVMVHDTQKVLHHHTSLKGTCNTLTDISSARNSALTKISSDSCSRTLGF